MNLPQVMSVNKNMKKVWKKKKVNEVLERTNKEQPDLQSIIHATENTQMN